jgi:hypothetical protein
MTQQLQPEICQKCNWLRLEDDRIDGFLVSKIQWCGLGLGKPQSDSCESKTGNGHELIFTPAQLKNIRAWVNEQFGKTDDNDHIVALEYVDSLLEHIKNTNEEMSGKYQALFNKYQDLYADHHAGTAS